MFRQLSSYLTSLNGTLANYDVLQRWRNHLLDEETARFLVDEDPTVSQLQKTIYCLRPGSTNWFSAFTLLTSHVSFPECPTDIIPCIRATIQILILYSVTTGDHQWLKGPELRCLERKGVELLKLISTPHPIQPHGETGAISSQDCLRRASVLERTGSISILHAEIIRALFNLAAKADLNLPLQTYDPINYIHTRNASQVLSALDPSYHKLTSMAFSLVIHPIIEQHRANYEDQRNKDDEAGEKTPLISFDHGLE